MDRTINFLEAELPQTKRFTKDITGSILVQSHPHNLHYTSHTVNYSSLSTLHRALLLHSSKNHCLLKGTLSRPLVNESRAGTTNRLDPTDLLVLDLDGLKNKITIDSFLKLVGLGDVDYIVQYSCSMGVIPEKGLSAHIFMMLDKPYVPAQLKQWLTHLNLNIPELKQNISLTRSKNWVRWGLDVSTCQNDKLIYISPPICEPPSLDTWKGERILLVKRSKTHAKLPANLPSLETLDAAKNARFNELRQAEGLPQRKKHDLKMVAGIEYLPKPNQAIITGIKEDRGFVYLNLNGGDSWGYYHPKNNPKYLFNFKGEPNYLINELLPDYITNQPAEETDLKTRHLAFRDFKSGQYWNGTWIADDFILSLAPAKSEKQLKDFMKQHGLELGDYIPTWDMEFDPSNATIVDEATLSINTYIPPPALRTIPKTKPKATPTTLKLIDHVLGSDKDAVTHFINWLSVIAQYKCRTQTAWVLHGVPGTGKGILLNRVLKPIFGYVTSIRMEQLEHQFNGFLEQSMICFVDEAQFGALERKTIVDANLKNYIVEPTIQIRHMRQAAYPVTNYANFLFASNSDREAPVQIDPSDRRFNVGAYQSKRLVPTDEELKQLESETLDFASYLLWLKADQDLARTPLNNLARDAVIHLSRNAIDIAAEAIRKGDLSFFEENLPTGSIESLPRDQYQRTLAYKTLVEEIRKEKPVTVSRDDLRVLLDYTVGNMPTTPYKFTSLIKHHGLVMTTVRHKATNQIVRGIPVNWRIN